MFNLVHFKGIHEDLIRELDISTDYGVPLVLSGGYDGEVLISNIQQLVDYADFPGKGYVMAYDVHQVVSSVSWNRFCSNLALATTEHGYLHMFDTRMSGHEGNAQVYNSHKNVP